MTAMEFGREYRCECATETGTRVVYVRARSAAAARTSAARWWQITDDAVSVSRDEVADLPRRRRDGEGSGSI